MIYVFSAEMQAISGHMVNEEMESPGFFNAFLWPFLWAFIDGMAKRFEPFLIGVYIYLRANQDRETLSD